MTRLHQPPRKGRPLFLLILWLAPLEVFAEWELVKTEDQIQVYSQAVPDSDFKAFKGVVTIDAPLASVLGVLDNVADCPNWMYLCSGGRLLKRESFKQRTIYQTIDFPFPARNRDLISQVKLSWDKESQTFTIDQKAASDYLPETGRVRIKRSEGRFLLTRISDRQTRVIWEQLVEPGGYLPGLLVNRIAVSMPFRSLGKLRLRSIEPPYLGLKMTFDDEGFPVGIAGASW